MTAQAQIKEAGELRMMINNTPVKYIREVGLFINTDYSSETFKLTRMSIEDSRGVYVRGYVLLKPGNIKVYVVGVYCRDLNRLVLIPYRWG